MNFSRRFDPVVREVREAIRKKKYGKVISASGIYTNGVLHNGSHLLDLARYLFGEVKHIKGVTATKDHGAKEPSVSGVATFEYCPQFSLMTGDERSYAIFELEILTERKRIRFANFGFDLVSQDNIPDPVYKGFRALSKPKTTPTQLAHAMENLYLHAAEILDGTSGSVSPLRDVILTQRACFELFNSLPKS